jgi:DNA-nicking Smr family endonuclease
MGSKPTKKSASGPTLDLHGFKKEDVHARLDRFLMDVTARGAKQVRVMTGKGTGVVQAEVIRLLKQGQYPWKFEKQANGTENTGVLVVFVGD